MKVFFNRVLSAFFSQAQEQYTANGPFAHNEQAYYECDLWLFEAKSHKWFVAVERADYGRWADICHTIEDEFKVKVLYWCVPLEHQKDTGGAQMTHVDEQSAHYATSNTPNGPLWLLRVTAPGL